MKFIPNQKNTFANELIPGNQMAGNIHFPSEFENLLQRRHYQKGFCLEKDRLFVPEIIRVETGSLRIIETGNDTAWIHGFLTPGDIYLDYLSINHSIDMHLSVQAMEFSSVLVLEYERVLELCNHSSIAREFLIQLATYSILNDIGHRRLLSGIEARKKIHMILESCPHWLRTFTKRDLSSYLGMAEESFSRLFHQMA